MKNILLIILVAFNATLAAQVRSRACDAEDIRVDELGNVYLLHESRIELLDRELEVVQVYNPSVVERIHHVDVSRSLRPMVFYRDQGKIVYLDNTLNEHNEPIDLYRSNFQRVEAAGVSVDNHIWLYDAGQIELYRLDQNLKIIQRSGNLGNWIEGDTHFQFVREIDDLVYLFGEAG
ncbi:MAG: hypothetical protein HKN32_02435, partial [Flavobacteriales bacterium]|nr:hypothetical protein [Flavobacteriales bacterium]